ncbi:hypothetical protein JX180_002521, partial [Enterococcus faecium]|nr:hypothetical protein [Enterococcus faecium]
EKTKVVFAKILFYLSLVYIVFTLIPIFIVGFIVGTEFFKSDSFLLLSLSVLFFSGIAYFSYIKGMKPAILKEKVNEEQIKEREKNEKLVFGQTSNGIQKEIFSVNEQAQTILVYDDKKKTSILIPFSELLGYDIQTNERIIQEKSIGAALLTSPLSSVGTHGVKKVNTLNIYLKVNSFEQPTVVLNIYKGRYLRTNTRSFRVIEEKMREITGYLDIILNRKRERQ